MFQNFKDQIAFMGYIYNAENLWIWGLIMRQSIGDKCLVFSGTGGDARELIYCLRILVAHKFPPVSCDSHKLRIIFSFNFIKTHHFKKSFFWGGARPVPDPSLGARVPLPHPIPPPPWLSFWNPPLCHPELQTDLRQCCHCSLQL